MVKNILLPFDGLKTNFHAVKYAISLSKMLNAKLHLIYIIDSKTTNSVKKKHSKTNERSKRILSK